MSIYLRHKIEDKFYLVLESLNKEFLASDSDIKRTQLADEVFDTDGVIHKHRIASTFKVEDNETVTVQLKKEHYDFLTALAYEMRTQDNRGTADPYFYVIQEEKKYIAPEGYGDGECIRRLEADGFYHHFTSQQEYTTFIAEQDYDFSCDSWDDLDEYDQHIIQQENNIFLTEKACAAYSRANKHNLGKHRSYVKYAHRNKEIQTLFEIIKQF